MSSLLMMMMPMACWQSSVTLAHYGESVNWMR